MSTFHLTVRLPRSAPQKSPILTPAALEQKRREAEERVAEELRQAKVARFEREAAKAAKAADDVARAPRTQAEQLRENERREIINKAQLALLVRTLWADSHA